MAKSIAKNALYSGIRTISSMLFPLITYPYVTRVLLAENLGKVDFSVSIVSYFALLAELGITKYATREGARVRNNPEELDRFCSEVFTINMASSLVAYALLTGLFVAWPHLHGYGLLIAIQSTAIIGTTIGVEWLYTLSEDFGYITARTIIVQVVSAVLLFTLVHDSSDFVIYAAITVFSAVGANVFNFLRSRRYARIRLVWHFDVRRHLVPMLILFGNTLATSIYINIDVTLLDVMRGDYEVGLYSVSVKIYKLMKQFLNAIVTVSVPRLSLYLGKKDHESYQSLLSSIVHALLVVILPVLLLIFLLSDYVVLIVGGESFLASAQSLRILCFALAPAVLAAFAVNCVLLTNRAERLILCSTVVGALFNLVLNLIVIPPFGANGAAMTTVLAELCVLIAATWFGRSYYNVAELLWQQGQTIVTCALGAIAIVSAHVIAHNVLGFSLLTFFVTGAVGTLLYAIILALRHDQIAQLVMAKIGIHR